MYKKDELIYESYINSLLERQDPTPQIQPVDEGDPWYVTLGKILDPTGISSYGDLAKASSAFNEKQNMLSGAILILALYSALPNFGLVTGAGGAIGWTAIKAAAKGAATKPTLLIKVSEKALGFIGKFPPLRSAFIKALDKLAAKGTLTSSSRNIMEQVIKKGSFKGLPSYSETVAKGVAKADAGKLAAQGVKGALKSPMSKEQIAKGAIRLGLPVAASINQLNNKLDSVLKDGEGEAGTDSVDLPGAEGEEGVEGGESSETSPDAGPGQKTGEISNDSIIDYLDQQGQPSDFESRKQLAQKMGIPNYVGTASQNLLMLNTLRSGKTEVPVMKATPVHPQVKFGGSKHTLYVDSGGGKYVPATEDQLGDPSVQLYARNPRKGQGEYLKPNFVKVRREGNEVRRKSQFGGVLGSLSNLAGDIGNTLGRKDIGSSR